MATDIVSGLFGINPAALQRARQEAAFAEDYKSVQLTPIQQGNLMLRQGARALGEGLAPLLGGQDPEMAKATLARQLATQFDITSAEGMRQYASALAQNGAPDLAQLAVQRANQLTTTDLATQKTSLDIQRTEQSLQKEDRLREELAKLPPNATDQQVIDVVSKYGSPDMILRVRQNSADRKALIASKAAAGQQGIGPLTPAQKAADISFAKDYTDFVNGGGIATIQKNLADIDKAIALLESGDTISGKTVGLADASGTLSYLFPKAAEAKDLTGGVVQSNLRQVLGGQFAAREGEQLLARAYNTAQPQADNLRRLKALKQQIETAAAAKIQAVQQYEQFGTLKGFQPQAFGQAAAGIGVPSADDPLGLRKKQQGNK